jgi:tRNA(fMet)-specific endonuclease VapC
VTLKYLLDTNVVSEPLRPEPAAGMLRGIRRHEGEMAVSSIVWHELQFGCLRLPKSHRRTAIERYLQDVVLPNFPILDCDRAAAEWHALERARLTAAGKTPPFIDGQIAAIARVNELVLVTSKKADFAGFKGLRLLSWV